VAAVDRLYDAFNRQDTEATRELMDPEIEWVNPEDALANAAQSSPRAPSETTRRSRCRTFASSSKWPGIGA
jgi:hypothetical protein